ncbi:13393_t:CDS:2, partial [Ambispora leptoticha]
MLQNLSTRDMQIQNQRAIAQQAKRQCEQIERAANRRAIAQQQRRERESSIRLFQNNTQHYLGRMDKECSYCGALHWLDERVTTSSKKNLRFGTCCHYGKVNLPHLQDPPLLLLNINQSVIHKQAPYSFQIHGELCHLSGVLLPDFTTTASYTQLYIYDSELVHQTRMNCNENLNPQM